MHRRVTKVIRYSLFYAELGLLEELYFWARVFDKPLTQTFVTQFRDKFSLAWDDANQFWDCPGHTIGYPGNDYNELA